MASNRPVLPSSGRQAAAHGTGPFCTKIALASAARSFGDPSNGGLVDMSLMLPAHFAAHERALRPRAQTAGAGCPATMGGG